jgi:hypothetical protein
MRVQKEKGLSLKFKVISDPFVMEDVLDFNTILSPTNYDLKEKNIALFDAQSKKFQLDIGKLM